MGFLVQYALASLLLSVVLVYLYDHTIGQAVNRVVRIGVFVGAWAAVTTFLGDRGFTRLIRDMRKGISARDKP